MTNISAVEIELSSHDLTNSESLIGVTTRQKSIRLTADQAKKTTTIRTTQGTHYEYYQVKVHQVKADLPQGVEATSVATRSWRKIEQKRILITAYYTQVISPDLIRFEMQRNDLYPVEFVLLHIKSTESPDTMEGELLVLDRETPVAYWNLWRKSLFAKLQFKWRAEIYFSAGSELPAAQIAWTQSQTTDLQFNSLAEVA